MARLHPLVVVLLSIFVFPFAVLSSVEFWGGRPTAKTDSGIVVGITTTVPSSRTKLSAFLGVPFGGQPLRFAAPKSPTPWTVARDASKTGPACIQQFNYPEPRRSSILLWFNTPPPPAGESEDCLSVNVYVPQPVWKPKPVMVWLYGGGLLYGNNGVEKYDGSYIAANNDVIVVVPNYRTNIFGFNGSPQVPVGERNPGFLDQRLALDWVQRNIAAFGGDPTKVTIFGESAGAASIDNLITAPPKPLPFRAAIMESGTSTFRGVPADYSTSWNALVAAMGCGNSSALKTDAPEILACMRALPATTIRDYNEKNRMAWTPVFDNVTSSYSARKDRLASKNSFSKVARVPILGGTNANEGRLYSVSAANATSFVRGLFPASTDAEVAALLAAYPGYSSEFRQLAALYTDFIFQCPARIVALESAQVGIPSYRYYYNASFPNSQIFDDAGVYHASEIGIALGTYDTAGATRFQTQLSTYIQKVWTDFAKDPYGFGKPSWGTVPAAMGELGGGVRAEDGPNASGELLTIMSQQETDAVDSGCAKFQAIYDFLGH